MNALTFLARQHQSFAALFSACRALRCADDELEAFTRLSQHVLAHHRVEELLFYPAVLAAGPNPSRYDAVDSHLDIELRVADILALDAGHPTFGANLELLEQSMLIHSNAEEVCLFPAVELALSHQALEDLGLRMEAMFNKLVEPRLAEGLPAVTLPRGTRRSANFELSARTGRAA